MVKPSRELASSDDLAPGDVLDDFEILRVMARSGMGSVFSARTRSSGAQVVLKVPHLQFEMDPAFYARFEREQRIGERLDHPSIAKALPVRDKSRPYIVMEHIEGRSLWRVMRESRASGRLPVDEVLAVGRQVCEALVYMHDQGVVHRDLKPENILVDARGRVHIIDFGVALDLSARRVTWGGFSNPLGTPEYMAPEQIRGKRGDARTDVYALGLILYELLSGHPAFAADDCRAIMEAKLHRSPRQLGEVASDIDHGIAEVVMRAVAPDPRLRFQSAGEMLAALRAGSLPAIETDARAVPAPSDSLRSRAYAAMGLLCAVVVTALSVAIVAR